MTVKQYIGMGLLASPFISIYLWAVLVLGNTWLGAAIPFVAMFLTIAAISTGVYLLSKD